MPWSSSKGSTLQWLVKHKRAAGQQFSVAETFAVGVAVARALSRAHRVTTPAGVPLEIVHRDITPPIT